MSRHPSTEKLLELSLEALPDQEAFELREHLLDCPECMSRMRLLLDDDEDPPSEELKVTAEQRAEDWARLSDRLATEAGDGKVTAFPVGPERHESSTEDMGKSAGWVKYGSMQVAAFLLLGVGVGTLVGNRLDFGPVTLSPLVSPLLFGDQSTRKGPEAADPLVCDRDFYLWRLLVERTLKPGTRLSAEIEDPEGRKETVAVQADGSNQIFLIRKAAKTPNGKYLIRLKKSSEPSRVIETFELTVSCD